MDQFSAVWRVEASGSGRQSTASRRRRSSYRKRTTGLTTRDPIIWALTCENVVAIRATMPTGPGDYANRAACRPDNYASTARLGEADSGGYPQLRGPVGEESGQLCQDNLGEVVDKPARSCQAHPIFSAQCPVTSVYVRLAIRATMPADTILAHVRLGSGRLCQDNLELSTVPVVEVGRKSPGQLCQPLGCR